MGNKQITNIPCMTLGVTYGEKLKVTINISISSILYGTLPLQTAVLKND